MTSWVLDAVIFICHFFYVNLKIFCSVFCSKDVVQMSKKLFSNTGQLNKITLPNKLYYLKLLPYTFSVY